MRCHAGAVLRSRHLRAAGAGRDMRVRRLGDGPIIAPGLHPSIGVNIQGPSAIRVPDWVAGRLGAYYLYFADHKGSYIRLAHADRPTGPWTVHPPGSLHPAPLRHAGGPLRHALDGKLRKAGMTASRACGIGSDTPPTGFASHPPHADEESGDGGKAEQSGISRSRVRSAFAIPPATCAVPGRPRLRRLPGAAAIPRVKSIPSRPTSRREAPLRSMFQAAARESPVAPALQTFVVPWLWHPAAPIGRHSAGISYNPLAWVRHSRKHGFYARSR